MTIPANLNAETNLGAIPVSIVTGPQGGPYTGGGGGANGVTVQGQVADNAAMAGNPVVTAGVDPSNNVQQQQAGGALTLLPSALRTATTTSATQTSNNYKGLTLTLNVTVASGTGGLKAILQGQDPVSGTWSTVFTATTAQTTTGMFIFSLYPGVTAGGTQASSVLLPAIWRAGVIPSDGSNYTYSLAALLTQ